MNLRFDVAVQGVQAVSLGQFKERKAVGNSERRGVGGAVRVAERGSREGLDREPEVRAAESRCPADSVPPAGVQCQQTADDGVTFQVDGTQMSASEASGLLDALTAAER